MNRVVVLGSSGAGKSTFSRQLGALFDLPVVHLDAHFWRTGWVEPARKDWAMQQLDLIQAPRWIMDGNYSGTLSIRLGVADTIIFIDLPHTLCTWRVLKRRVMYHGRSRPDVPADCPEAFDWEFIRWTWRYPYDKRPTLLRKLAALQATKHIIHLRSTRTVKQFLERQKAATEKLIS